MSPFYFSSINSHVRDVIRVSGQRNRIFLKVSLSLSMCACFYFTQFFPPFLDCCWCALSDKLKKRIHRSFCFCIETKFKLIIIQRLFFRSGKCIQPHGKLYVIWFKWITISNFAETISLPLILFVSLSFWNR